MKDEQLRAVTNDDKELLFHWANDTCVRAASFQTEAITWETKVKWFEKMLDNANILQYIYEYDGKPAGQVRLNLQEGKGLISYSIAEEFRGTGRAKRMLALLEDMIKVKYPDIRELEAEVKCENEASKHVFKTMDYQETYVLYRKHL